MLKKRNRRTITLIVCFLVLAIVSTIYINQYRNVKYEKTTGQIKNWEKYVCDVKNYSQDENRYSMTGDDPHVLFDFNSLNEDINGIKIDFTGKVGPIQIFAFDGNIDAMDRNSVAAEKGSSIEYCGPAQWKNYRLDVDSDFEIENVEYISMKPVHSFNILKYLIAYILNLIVAGIIAYSDPVYIIFSQLKDEERLKRKIGFFIAGTAMSAVIAYVFERGIVYAAGYSYVNPYRRFAIWGILEILVIVAVLWKNFIQELHLILFAVIIILGAINVYATPIEVGVSWDDEIHYARALYLADGMTDYAEAEEIRLIDKYAQNIYQQDIFTRDERNNSISVGNRYLQDGVKEVAINGSGISIWSIAYVPAAFGIYVARLAGLPFADIFRMGKMFNVLFYAFVFAWAVKSLKKNGKMFCAAIALIPTNIFLTSNYAYDWWVTSWLCLAFAKLYGMMESEEKISTFDFAKIVGIAFLAILPKAIYVVVFIPFLLIPSEKIEKAVKSRLIALAGMFAGLCTFVLPILYNVSANVSAGDMRGGSDINSTAQLIYIFSHPVRYIEVLFRFLWQYFSVDLIPSYTTHMSYYGIGRFGVAVMIIVIVIAIIDNERKFACTVKSAIVYRSVTCVSCLLTVMAVATALYLDFTAVGSDTILGCQSRYLIPVLFPGLYCLFYNKLSIGEKIKNCIFALAIMSLSCIYIYNLYSLMINRY